MSLLERLKKELFYFGLSSEEYSIVRASVWDTNRTSVMAWSAFASMFWIMSLVMSLYSPAYVRCRLAYIVALTIDVAVLVGTLLLTKRHRWTLLPLSVLLDLSLLGAGIGIAYFQPDVRTVTFIVLSTIVPVSTIKRTISVIGPQCLAILAYVLLTKDVIVPDVYSWGLTNITIFSVAGLLMGHFVNRSRAERYVFEEASKKAAQLQMRYAYFDQMTGLKNRRAFSEAMEQLDERMPKDLCLVIADINGLKLVNDNLGHAAGDELIVAAATCLTSAFDDSDIVYRIGGDEFCVTVTGTLEETSHHLEKLDELMANWKGRYIKGFSLSYGVASSQGHSNFESIVREADRKMYDHKREYYMNNEMQQRRYEHA